jgi:hypothetical protein
METFDTTSRIAVLENEVKNIGMKIEEMREEQKEQHEALCNKFDSVSSRITVLEKWRWMIFGGAIVVGYILAHVRIDKLF